MPPQGSLKMLVLGSTEHELWPSHKIFMYSVWFEKHVVVSRLTKGYPDAQIEELVRPKFTYTTEITPLEQLNDNLSPSQTYKVVAIADMLLAAGTTVV